MTTFRFPDRRLSRLGGFVMLTLLVMAAVFWRERTWLLDVAFQTFLMVKDETVQVMVYRFGAATVQSLPLLGILLDLPLAVVSWLYSVSFHLHFGAFFALAAFFFRREDVALGIVLLYTAMTCDGFYWQTSELQQGLGFLLVSWAALLRYPDPGRWWGWLPWIPVLVALAFYHPLVFLPFYFFLVWHWWKPQAGIPRSSLLRLGIGMGVVLIGKQRWFQNWYDLQKTAQFKANLIADFPNYFTYPAYSAFFQNLALYWWGYVILFAVVAGWLVRDRRWLALFFILLTSLGFLVLTAIGDPITPYRFYAEVNYYPLLAFLLVPLLEFLRNVSQKSEYRRWLFLSLMVFLSARLLLIGWRGGIYEERVDYLRQLTGEVEEQPDQRLLVSPSSLNQDVLLMDWGLPYETLIQSATESTRPVSLLSLTDPEARKAETEADSLFVTPWTSFSLREVNHPAYWFFPEAPYGAWK